MIVDVQLSHFNEPKQLIKNQLKLNQNEQIQATPTLRVDQRCLNLSMQAIARRARAEVIRFLTSLFLEQHYLISSKPNISIFKVKHYFRPSFDIDQASINDRAQEK